MNPLLITRTLQAWGPRLILVATVLALLSQLGLAASIFLSDAWKAVSFPYPLDYGEGPLLDQTLRLARFESIYHGDFNRPPYTVANYPPLFLLLQAPFAWLAGPAFWYGRAISTLGMLLGATCLGLMLHTLTKSRLAAVTGGLTLLAFPYVLYWAPMNRVDSLALGLSLAGLLVAVRWPERRTGRIAAAVLLTAAILTRQSYGLAAPLAAFFWLVSAKPRWRGVELAAYVAGLGLTLMLLLTLLTNGAFFTNVVTANVNPYFWSRVQVYIDQLLDHAWPILLMALTFLMLGWRRHGKGETHFQEWRLIAPYLLGATLSALTVGKAGSSVNYLLEFCAALSLAAGTVVAWANRFFWLQIAVLCLLIYQLNGLLDWYQKDHRHWLDNKYQRSAEIARMIEIARLADRPVLADEYIGVVPLAGKPLVFQPFEYQQLLIAGLWDERPFLDEIHQGRFAAIIILDDPHSRRKRWSPAQLAAIDLAYQPFVQLVDAIVYMPRRP